MVLWQGELSITEGSEVPLSQAYLSGKVSSWTVGVCSQYGIGATF